MMKIDINCDLGESFGNYTFGIDEEIINFVTSVNIACGFHAGDPVVMEKTVKLALQKGKAIGAHPGFQDLVGFGRRDMSISLEETRALIIYQVGALAGFVKANGGKLRHVKPHGALYNMAAKNYNLALAIAQAVYDIDSDLIFLGLANSMLIKAGRDVGLQTASEIFSDRGYNDDGSLVSRNSFGGFIQNKDECAKRVLRMICESKVLSIQNSDISIETDSVCIHSDTPNALELASFLYTHLLQNGVELKAIIHS